MKYKFLHAFLVVILLLCACSSSGGTLPTMGFEELLQTSRDNHAYLFLPMDEAYIDGVRGEYAEWIDAQLDREIAEKLRSLSPQEEQQPTAVVTQAQAVEDARFLMDYLQTGYAGYAFFGGPEVFGPLREELLDRVGSLGEEVGYTTLVQCLREALYPVIPDMHFQIDGLHQSDRQACYTIESPVFLLESGQPVDAGNGAALRGVQVDGIEYAPKELLQPWLEPDGRLVYRLILQQEAGNVLLRFDHGDDTPALRALDTATEPQSGGPLWELEDRDGIPVLRCRSLMPMSEEEYASMDEFVGTAALLRDQPYLIVDLRGNPGGMAFYGSQWLGQLTGLDADYFEGGMSITLYSETARANYPAYYGDWYYEEYDVFQREEGFPGYQVDCGLAPRSPVQTEQTIIVLIDSTTGSAAEYFANFLSMLENTILVGSPSKGQFHFGLNVGTRLPHSGISIGNGMNLYLLPDLEIHDGTGFAPDVWCDSETSLEAALALAATLQADGR